MSAAQADWKAYLEWQAELGGEEVVLAAPMVRSTVRSALQTSVRSTVSVTATNPETRDSRQSDSTLHPYSIEDAPYGTLAASPGTGSKPYSAPVAIGPEFFSAIAEKLAKTTVRGKAATAASAASATSAASAPAPVATSGTAAVPAFDDLEAYWNWLNVEYLKWFPSATLPLTRAVGHPSPRLAVVELSPAAGGLFAGDAGVMLDKMMSAIGLRREDLYLTSVMKTPSTGKAWARKDIARMLPALFRELKLAQCGLVLVLGEPCAQAVLRTGRGIAALTGSATETEGLSLSATWHPDEIRAGESAGSAAGSAAGSVKPEGSNERPLSREAWTHLQWLRGRLPARGS